MTVSGLNSDNFLSGNPLPITITPDTVFSIGDYVNVTIIRLVTHPGDIETSYPPIRLYVQTTGVTVDLMPYIKGMMPYPYIPTTTYQDPVPNTQNFTIIFSASIGGGDIFFNKTVVRGFKRTKSNSGLTVTNGTILKESDRIPVWGAYPTAKFTLTASQIIPSTILDPEDLRQMKIPIACNPFYVRFLNTLGGYSFWMFNAWEWDTKSKPSGMIEKTTDINNVSLGFKETNEVKVDTRVRREFFGVIRALVVSPVVQVYDQFDMDWLKIELKDTSFNENNYEDMQEFSCTFDLMLNTSPEVLW